MAIKMLLPLDGKVVAPGVPRTLTGRLLPLGIGTVSSMMGIGGGTFSVPALTLLNQTLDLFTSKTVKVLLPNAQTESASTKQVEQAATAAGVPVVPVTETLPAGTDDYITWQSGQIDQLSTALGTPAS